MSVDAPPGISLRAGRPDASPDALSDELRTIVEKEALNVYGKTANDLQIEGTRLLIDPRRPPGAPPQPKVLIVAKTGKGKSLIFYLLTTLLPGIYCPLITLAVDQYGKLSGIDSPNGSDIIRLDDHKTDDDVRSIKARLRAIPPDTTRTTIIISSPQVLVIRTSKGFNGQPPCENYTLALPDPSILPKIPVPSLLYCTDEQAAVEVVVAETALFGDDAGMTNVQESGEQDEVMMEGERMEDEGMSSLLPPTLPPSPRMHRCHTEEA